MLPENAGTRRASGQRTGWADGAGTAWPGWQPEQDWWPEDHRPRHPEGQQDRQPEQDWWPEDHRPRHPEGQQDRQPEQDWWPEDHRPRHPEGQQDRQPDQRRQAADRAGGRRFRADPEPAGDERWAMLSYIGVPFLSFLMPLTIRLARGRGPGFVRDQATQALNLSVTGLLYAFCALLLGGILALDSIIVALLIAAPVATALWIAMLVYVVRAAAAASRGRYLQIPAWICATMWR